MWRAAPGAGDEAPQLYALLRQDLSQALLKRLSMFVLRAKAKLAATALHACGVRAANDAQLAALEAAAGPLPRQTWERAELPSGTWIAAPSAAGERRWWWIASDAQLAGASALAGALTLTDADAWRAADLAAGIPGSAPPPRICSFRRPSTWN